jgi:hypothetical protein
MPMHTAPCVADGRWVYPDTPDGGRLASCSPRSIQEAACLAGFTGSVPETEASSTAQAVHGTLHAQTLGPWQDDRCVVALKYAGRKG